MRIPRYFHTISDIPLGGIFGQPSGYSHPRTCCPQHDIQTQRCPVQDQGWQRCGVQGQRQESHREGGPACCCKNVGAGSEGARQRSEVDAEIDEEPAEADGEGEEQSVETTQQTCRVNINIDIGSGGSVGVKSTDEPVVHNQETTTDTAATDSSRRFGDRDWIPSGCMIVHSCGQCHIMWACNTANCTCEHDIGDRGRVFYCSETCFYKYNWNDEWMEAMYDCFDAGE